MLNRPHTYMEMLSILSAGLLPRDPTEAEEQRIRASAITLSGAEGAAQDVLDRFSTKGSNTAIEELITATKVLYELFAINARQAAYLVAGATLLGLWPAELVRNASANEPPGDGPHRMVEGIRSALGLQPTGLQDALRSEPLASIFHVTVDLPVVDLGCGSARRLRTRCRAKARRSGRVRVSGSPGGRGWAGVLKRARVPLGAG